MTTEQGFYHPEAGYWQTTGDVPDHILETYPAGYSRVPPKPGENYDWISGAWVEVVPSPTSSDINAERDRRIYAGFNFNGVLFDFDDRAKANISGAAQLAFMAITAGAEEGDLNWNSNAQPFAWIAADNTLIPMDAHTVVEFGRTAAQHEQTHIFAARALKDLETIPVDYSDDSYWP